MKIKEEKDQIALLKKVLCFKYLDDNVLRSLKSAGDFIKYKDLEDIVVEHDDSLHFFAVMEGTVTVHVNKQGQGEVYISSIGSGEVFGEAGIFLKMKRTATIRSRGESLIFKIHRQQLIQFINANASSGVKVLMIVIHGLLRKLRESNQELAYERRLDAEQSEIDSLVEEILK
ncbi:cyclic nucleotide-binding domain-containing protein [Spirochaeta cellobiosiphila]|uniref:cyclic nucleotide-binding domain-containing protein n=1 Tax=Spirochaeta cellobiosiphila TaxID=504483 RepID=UPI00041CE834|nr:cyclic nucleotide-binding domain-containing protein [Spirochaeta cellobiosiphila]